MPRTLGPDDFAAAFGEPLSNDLRERVGEYGFIYDPLEGPDRDAVLRRITDVLLNVDLVRAGEDRLSQWEAGWGDNFETLTKTNVKEAITPGYFGKYDILRWRQGFIRPLSPRFEYNSFAVIQDWLFDKYLRNVPAIYEFGCGTGHNLFRARRVNPTATLWGLDWTTASQKIIDRVRTNGIDPRMFGRRFDFFHPDPSIALEPGAAIYTAAALEQTGDRYGPFLDWLLARKPALCLHIEPIAELLDPTNLVDFLSISYFQRRNYLSGFLTRLRRLEDEGRLSIHMAKRTFIGSLFIEGYSVIAWSPNPRG